VFIRDLVSLYAEVVRSAYVDYGQRGGLRARKPEREEVVKVTEATDLVAVDENRQPRVVSAQQ
jgi:hypothetical protein